MSARLNILLCALLIVVPFSSVSAQTSAPSKPQFVQSEILGQGLSGFVDHLSSPDHLHVAMVFNVFGSSAVVTDGQWGAKYDEIAKSSLVYSPDSSDFAYWARKGNKWLVVVDGREQNAVYDLPGIGTPIFSPDSKRLAYIGVKDNRVYTIVDGQQSAAYGSIDVGTLIFSPDSKHIVYLAKKNDQYVTV